MIHNSAYHL
jgi:hypothetical protein